MNIRVAGIVRESIVDGEGIRLAVFTQGCPHKCLGCHNPETWSIFGGKTMYTDEILSMLSSNPILSGITLTGGEPFMQIEACADLAKATHEMGKTVWVYTGYTLEHLQSNHRTMDLLEHTDVLVDGPFILEKKTLDLPFRGSSNQRIIPLRDGKPEVIK